MGTPMGLSLLPVLRRQWEGTVFSCLSSASLEHPLALTSPGAFAVSCLCCSNIRTFLRLLLDCKLPEGPDSF